jgi:hypothetical protein
LIDFFVEKLIIFEEKFCERMENVSGSRVDWRRFVCFNVWQEKRAGRQIDANQQLFFVKIFCSSSQNLYKFLHFIIPVFNPF